MGNHRPFPNDFLDKPDVLRLAVTIVYLKPEQATNSPWATLDCTGLNKHGPMHMNLEVPRRTSVGDDNKPDHRLMLSEIIRLKWYEMCKKRAIDRI